MKKFLKYLWIFLLPLCLLACGDDDKGSGDKDSDKGSVNSSSLIIGKWQIDDDYDDEVIQYVFRKDATFSEISWIEGYKDNTYSVDKGTFTFNDRTGKLVLRYQFDDYYDDDEEEIYDITFIDDDTLIAIDSYDGGRSIFYRIK